MRLLSILVLQHTCNVETCLRLYYMAVSIFCTALYTTDTSQMAEYTLNELADMHLLYGETRGNSRAARRLYAERFPMRRLQSHVLFQRIHARIRETGHVGPSRRGAGEASQCTTQHGAVNYSKWKPPCSTNVNTFQHCRYAVAREWIVNANVLTLLTVASLR